jgi:hypothetical protein
MEKRITDGDRKMIEKGRRCRREGDGDGERTEVKVMEKGQR